MIENKEGISSSNNWLTYNRFFTYTRQVNLDITVRRLLFLFLACIVVVHTAESVERYCNNKSHTES